MVCRIEMETMTMGEKHKGGANTNTYDHMDNFFFFFRQVVDVLTFKIYDCNDQI